jgi:acetyltransferase-like isoleucine patch superfamily enzyme
MKFKKLLKRMLFWCQKPRHSHSWKKGYEVGRGTYGKPKIRRFGAPTTLKVGCFCSIATKVQIFLSGNHRTDWITTYPFSLFRESAKHIGGHPASRGDVIIDHDVWIGHAALILSGVHIANGAVIGASAVVTRDVPAYSIVAGNPAKVVRMRFSENEISILQSIEWWNWDDSKLDSAMPYLLDGDVSALQAFSSKYDLSSEQGAESEVASRRT